MTDSVIEPLKEKAPPQKRDTLFVTDKELIERLGIPKQDAWPVLKMLDENKKSGFPQKSKLWGGRRYWPAVKAYFDRTNGLTVETPQERRAS